FFSPLPAATSDLHPFPTRRSSDLSLSAPDHRIKPLDRLAIELVVQNYIGIRVSIRPPVPQQKQQFIAPSRSIDAHKSFQAGEVEDRKSTRLNSSHVKISYAVFCL